MIKCVCYDTELRIWWDKRIDKKDAYRYKITIDNCAYVFTHNVYYDFKNLKSGKEYYFEVELVDEKGNAIGRKDRLYVSTLMEREVVDITLPPYNAVGDGQTDNTDVICRACNECNDGKIIYFPMGVYLCKNFEYSGDVQFRFDADAVLCDDEGVSNL